jgi:hypothetical protein
MRLPGRRSQRVLWIAIVLSIAIHFVIGPLLSRFQTPLPQQSTSDFIVTSSSVRIEHRTVPEPHHPTKPVVQPVPRPVPQPHVRNLIVTPKLSTPEPRHELARNDPRAVASQAAPHAAPTIDTITLERQERQYAKVIAQAKADNNPLAVPSSTPAAYKPYTLSFAGVNNHLHAGEGVLYPTKSWRQDGYDYYYVDYSVVFADGASDEGHVPWPIRYRPGEDPFVLHYEHFPLPAPLPGYVLPQSELPLNRTLRPYFPEIYPHGE